VTTVILIAKEPLPGKAKTRLHPPLSLEQAAALAAAAISDTLAMLSRVAASRRILLFDGERVPPGASDFETVAQGGGTLDERLAAAFDGCSGPTLLVGMDTPQLESRHIAPALTAWPDDIDAWFGPATDGGFWALAMREPRGDLIRGVPMSRSDTGALQRRRLVAAGLAVGQLETLTDVDTIEDARVVATVAPTTAFARLLRAQLAVDSQAALRQ